MVLVYLIGVIAVFAFVEWIVETMKKARKLLRDKNSLETLARDNAKREVLLKHEQDVIAEARATLSREREEFAVTTEKEVARIEALKAESITAIESLGKEKALGFPWVATAYSEYRQLYDLQLANDLENRPRPAKRAADHVREMAAEKTSLRREKMILRNLLLYYESLFPWLTDFVGEDIDDLIRQATSQRDAGDADTDDPATQWLSQAEAEHASLTRAEKCQRALDRYWSSKKTPWQIGQDYERYIGYLHEQEGFSVEYHGIQHGLEDMGRDLVCRKNEDIRIVQCKRWSASKSLHEKHVCQTYGTAIAYARKLAEEQTLFNQQVTAWLYVSCPASETAKHFAKLLDVYLMDNFALAQYPIIKCNISRRDGSKIYHLPFDQQYDRTLIDHEDECYVQTVAEAEALGFRRAYRWSGVVTPA